MKIEYIPRYVHVTLQVKTCDLQKRESKFLKINDNQDAFKTSYRSYTYLNMKTTFLFILLTSGVYLEVIEHWSKNC